jgi:hemolysin activation/secretion protein
MLRLGGWNSFRGFNENSLLADAYYFGTAEYRYLIGEQAFFDVFGQYGQVNNKNINTNTTLYSVGLGFNFFLPIGLMSFQISNGNPVGNPIKFNDTKIHWGILAKF